MSRAGSPPPPPGCDQDQAPGSPPSRSPSPESESSSSSDSEDSLYDVDSIIKGNQMEALRNLQSNQNSSVNIKSEPQEHPSDAGKKSSSNGNDDLFKLAAGAEKLLQEILGRSAASQAASASVVKSEPVQPPLQPSVLPPTSLQHPPPQTPPHQQHQQQIMFAPNMMTSPYFTPNLMHPFQSHHQIPVPNNLVASPAQFAFPPPGPEAAKPAAAAFFVSHPPPAGGMIATPTGSPMLAGLSQAPFYYPIQAQAPPQPSPTFFHQPFSPYPPPPHHHLSPHALTPPPHLQIQPQFPFAPYLSAPPSAAALSSQFLNGQRKRKFGENTNYNNNGSFGARFKAPYQASNGAHLNGGSYLPKRFPGGVGGESADGGTSSGGAFMPPHGTGLNEEGDLNIMRERELKDLKCKSVVEKMSVFLKYYQQFKEAYIQRVQTIECSDSLKIQFNSLIKNLSDYESCLAELDEMITEHERVQCKNNHRKTKRLFNKTKTFIRYECHKRLQSNIFEYRRLINSQDRYAGMYDLLDLNNYLMSLLPEIGVSMRRYINRCEKARQEAEEEEQLDEEDTAYGTAGWNSDDSNAGAADHPVDASDIKIPSFKEFVASNGASFGNDDSGLEKENKKKQRSSNDDDDDDDDEDDDDDDDEEDEPPPEEEDASAVAGHGESSKLSAHGRKVRGYESFSKGVDTLNKYLLKRVEEEETLDELVKERIIKWINKRQSKYILIFSEVDRLLNQHQAGECYPKFHSYLLFNLGKLVTVCDSYHQKLKELLYSTTIRRKKKRKRVKQLPEAMADVFNEIKDLKRCLESAKLQIKRCNELKPKPAAAATAASVNTATTMLSSSVATDAHDASPSPSDAI